MDGSLRDRPLAEVLARSGWFRAIGGSNPYLAAHARLGISRADADALADALDVAELPAARGCTYVVGKEDFQVALSVGREGGLKAELAMARKYLGVGDEEISRLEEAVLDALRSGPMDSKQLKAAVGAAARSLGDEGKKRGMATTMPLATSSLRAKGKIINRPANGRFDTQRYVYSLWPGGGPNPDVLESSKAYSLLAERFFKWIGPAQLAHFQWFSGLSKTAATEAIYGLGLVELGEGWLIPAEDASEFGEFEPTSEPDFKLCGSLDNITHLLGTIKHVCDENDLNRQITTHDGLVRLGDAKETWSHPIYDRGRLVGIWEFDSEEDRIVWHAWVGKSSMLTAAVTEMESFIRDHLGDAKSFSLDSPKSRAPRIALIKQLAAGQT